MGAEADRAANAGAEIFCVSVDSEDRQRVMFQRWPLPMVRFISDPGGERLLQPMGLFDPVERDGIALPGLVVITPDGDEAYRYVGRDFADRTTDDEMWEALAALGLPPIEMPEGGPADGATSDAAGAFRADWFVPYFKGNFFAAAAIGGRLESGSPGRQVAREHRMMADASLAAFERLTR